MLIPTDVLDDTARRVAQSEAARKRVLGALRKGESPLNIDSPDRARMRLSRLHQDAPGFERLLGKSNFVEACVLERAVVVSRAVGRVTIRNAHRRVIGWGTGFMISRSLLMTNNHVLESAAVASRSQIEFNYQTGLDGKLLPPVTFELDPGAFFFTDRSLDFTVVAVRPDPTAREPLEAFGFCPLKPELGKVLIGEHLNVVQHPNGEPKQVAIRENTLTALLDDFLHYETDTAPGSSGSPVFNDQWEVVALHHSGVPARDENGNYLNLDGEPWDDRQGEQRLKWIANEGVRISRIFQRLMTVAPDHFKHELTGDTSSPVFSMPSSKPPKLDGTPTVGLTALSVGPTASGIGPSTPGVGLTVENDGSTTITLPVSLNIQVGAAGLLPTVPRSPAAPRVHPASVVAPVQPSGAGVSAPGVVAAMAEALAELERAREAPYYDSTEDVLDRDAYYEGVDLAANPEQLYEALHELLASTHHTKLRYKPAEHVYPLVDLQPNGMLRSIYSWKEFDPEHFIREDFRVELERAARLQEMMMLESSRGLEECIDLLEALLPYNCEHVVPQSWFSKKEPMRGDLHHLFACEVECNSFRGNIPYWDFPDFEEAERKDCGKRLATKFEPTNGKGEVARAVLYFLLRYPGEINATEQEYQEDRLRILVSWHKAHPVTEHERHRNRAIFRKQGNRNPLIDFPDLVDEIDFSQGLGLPP
ncbi:MAG: endonuclease [Pseudomonadota bacterium]